MLTTCVRHLVQYRLRHPFSIWPLACPSHILIIMTTKSLMLLVNNNIVYIVTELLCSVDLFSVQCIHSRHNFSGLSDDDHNILITIIIYDRPVHWCFAWMKIWSPSLQCKIFTKLKVNLMMMVIKHTHTIDRFLALNNCAIAGGRMLWELNRADSG